MTKLHSKADTVFSQWPLVFWAVVLEMLREPALLPSENVPSCKHCLSNTQKVFLTFGVPFTFKLKCQVIVDKVSFFFSVLVTWASSSSHSCHFTTAAFCLPSAVTFSLMRILSIWLEAYALFITQHCLPWPFKSAPLMSYRRVHLWVKPFVTNPCSPRILPPHPVSIPL